MQALSQKQKELWIYGLAALFIIINMCLTIFEIYYFNFLPVLLVIFLMSLFYLDKLILLVVFFTPLAINLSDPDVRLGLSMPTEPLMFGIMILFILKLFHRGKFDRAVMRHPITIAILANLAWIFITSLTSEMPAVSFKFLLARLWFVIVFYFLATQLFKNYPNIKRFAWLYIIPFIIVIFYTLYQHAKFDFAEKPADWVMKPFYNDHTIYGAILAMFFPLLFVFAFNSKYKLGIRIITGLIIVLFTIATIFSYTRAAWISLAAALLAFITMRFGIRFRTILIIFLAFIGVAIIYNETILMRLEKNKQDASANFTEHMQSITNISSDASNVERLNRWYSGIRMFKERPIFGWGPGTYTFQYAPFQRPQEKTIISTNMGDGGNAHSEYIGPLTESGILGSLTFIVIMLVVLNTGYKLYYKVKEKEVKALVCAITLGLLTYFVHGTLNNFLDTDKASVPFWGFIAILTTIDLYHSKKSVDAARE